MPERTNDDVLSIGIWPEKFNPAEMLQKVNDGNTIFEGNQMIVRTPIDTKGYPIEFPRDIYMIAFVDLSILVEVAAGDGRRAPGRRGASSDKHKVSS